MSQCGAGSQSHCLQRSLNQLLPGHICCFSTVVIFFTDLPR